MIKKFMEKMPVMRRPQKKSHSALVFVGGVIVGLVPLALEKLFRKKHDCCGKCHDCDCCHDEEELAIGVEPIFREDGDTTEEEEQ